jgi:hypothetical protein
MEGPTSKFFHIEENNIILFGNRDIFKSYHNRTSKYKQNIPDKFQFEQILKQNTLYSIEMPTNLQGKNRLGKHITQLFKNEMVILVRKGEKQIEKKIISSTNPLKLKSELQTCRNCLIVKKNLKVCARCKTAHYCNQQCQISDWEVHKFYCIRK